LNFSSIKAIYSKIVFMKKLDPIFGFDINFDDEGNVVINDMCEYPQLSKNCQTFFNKLEHIKIDECEITFPTQLKEWAVIISPTDKETITEYFKIDGIKKVVEKNKPDLIGKTTFIKPEIYYPVKSKYPNLIIHFYQLVNEGGVLIDDAYDMIEFCQIYYENTKQFTKKRIANLEKYVNAQELLQIPFLPIELVRFNETGNIKDFENHLLAKSASELPF
jgi:hypothetical protein